MASFMSKKKKFKFQVEINVEELVEVPFLSAVLFAKLRLLDGGSFQDTSARVEVKEHRVKWGAKFSFPCKMQANVSTGVLERCILRISVRRESKGGRSFDKLGFVDLNLAEYAGSGLTSKKALLEGYVNRHTRQDNSMLRFSIRMNMLSGDVLFKVPSPSAKHKQPTVISHAQDESSVIEVGSTDFSGGSLAGSIASGSSGFGSLTKKRTPLLSSDLVTGLSLQECPIDSSLNTTDNNIGESVVVLNSESNVDNVNVNQQNSMSLENEMTGHSRNSSNTSQMSKGSAGYSSSINSNSNSNSNNYNTNTHSRQSSSTSDSGHIRATKKWQLSTSASSTSNFLSIPSTFLENSSCFSSSSPNISQNDTLKVGEEEEELFHTPKGYLMSGPNFESAQKKLNFYQITLKSQISQNSNVSNSSNDDYHTPNCSFNYNQSEIDANALIKYEKNDVCIRKNLLGQNKLLKSGSCNALNDAVICQKCNSFIPNRNSDDACYYNNNNGKKQIYFNYNRQASFDSNLFLANKNKVGLNLKTKGFTCQSDVCGSNVKNQNSIKNQFDNKNQNNKPQNNFFDNKPQNKFFDNKPHNKFFDNKPQNKFFDNKLDSKTQNKFVNKNFYVSRSKSDFQIPKNPQNSFLSNQILSLITPLAKRRNANLTVSTPKNPQKSPNSFKIPHSPIYPHQNTRNAFKMQNRTSSLTSLRGTCTSSSSSSTFCTSTVGSAFHNCQCQCSSLQRSLPPCHRNKLMLETNSSSSSLLALSGGGKSNVGGTNEEDPPPLQLNVVLSTNESNINNIPASRRPSITNPSAGSLVLSETGSLDRAKAAMERRKKVTNKSDQDANVSLRVEGTRVNPDDLIDELINNTDLEPNDDSTENSGLQLFIAKDGTAALGNSEVKSQMQTGIRHFKQVVMDNANR